MADVREREKLMRQNNNSEVMRLLNQIEMEYVAATCGMSEFAETATHTAITARMENLGMLHEHLRAVVGDDATKLMSERLESIPAE